MNDGDTTTKVEMKDVQLRPKLPRIESIEIPFVTGAYDPALLRVSDAPSSKHGLDRVHEDKCLCGVVHTSLFGKEPRMTEQVSSSP